MKQLTDLIELLPDRSLYFLCASLLVLIATLFLIFRFPEKKWNYAGIFIAIALAGFAFASIHEFLVPWDEQFHALVAKNMAEDPFHPKLMKGITFFHYKDWTQSEIWLHKQPLFMWQMALSIKIFGSNLLAVRLPSILLHATATCMLFSLSKRTLSLFFSVIASLLYGYSTFMLDFISGIQGMDHNDAAFTFYIIASCWSWMKYQETGQRKWLVITGLFAGGAVLCKWITGFVVFWVWFIVSLAKRELKHQFRPMLTSFLISVAVFLPWQIWCLIKFPVEYTHEITYNQRHFFESLEGHGGDSWYYIDGMRSVFGGGDFIITMIFAGFFLTIIHFLRTKNKFSLFSVIIFVTIYLFFTVAATKLPGYVAPVSFAGFIFLVTPFDRLISWIRTRKRFRIPFWTKPFLAVTMLLLFFQAKSTIERNHLRTPENFLPRIKEINYAERIIKKYGDNNCYLIKNSRNFSTAAIAFGSNARVYDWNVYRAEAKVFIIDMDETRKQ